MKAQIRRQKAERRRHRSAFCLHPSAFTLVETMLAVAILALLAGLAVWSFAGPLKKARASEAIEQVRLMDAGARAVAKKSGRAVKIVFDLSEGTIARREGNRTTMELNVGAPMKIEAVRTAGRRTEVGDAEVEIGAGGLGQTYAVLLSSAEERRWVVFAGLSGQSVVTDEKEVEAIFARVASRRQPD